MRDVHSQEQILHCCKVNMILTIFLWISPSMSTESVALRMKRKINLKTTRTASYKWRLFVNFESQKLKPKIGGGAFLFSDRLLLRM